ncbi:hypothetical protein K488DRAFT_90284 [Vararia minispora EC-137]|uniref:Uncharacterized protein n=1 Tax=Vararia minispora EC-137 TaxID=1314806 RepID=A0ACB8Q9M2_9AGAM|nr:hypothetical protein K488DRAFT_90284 [Vararia minispora EC-137]
MPPIYCSATPHDHGPPPNRRPDVNWSWELGLFLCLVFAIVFWSSAHLALQNRNGEVRRVSWEVLRVQERLRSGAHGFWVNQFRFCSRFLPPEESEQTSVVSGPRTGEPAHHIHAPDPVALPRAVRANPPFAPTTLATASSSTSASHLPNDSLTPSL